MADAALLVISGPPGAGKSTVARTLAGPGAELSETGPTVLVEGDRFFDFLTGGFIEPWLPESADQNAVVIEATAAATGRFVAAGWATVFDGVVGPWFIDAFLAGVGVAEADYAVLLPSLQRCQDRVSTRLDHGFGDLEATAKMHTEFATADLGAGHLLDNGGEEPEHTVERLLAARADGSLRYRS